jgi:Na+/H+ antiporter NhaA
LRSGIHAMLLKTVVYRIRFPVKKEKAASVKLYKISHELKEPVKPLYDDMVNQSLTFKKSQQ